MSIPVRYNLRNLVVRRVATLMTSAGIACVVAVFVVVLALAEGFRAAVAGTGRADNALIMRDGSDSEIQSFINREGYDIIRTSPLVVKDDEGPLICADVVLVISHPKISTGEASNVTVRGVEPAAFRLREGVVKIAEGRMMTPGTSEVIVGRSISRRIQDCHIGGTIRKAGRDWNVVGTFDAGGSAFESEIWGDVDVVLQSFNREVYQSVTARLRNPGDVEAWKQLFASDPRLRTFQVQREDQYYAAQTERLATLIRVFGTAVTIVMMVGAVMGAMNTMYAAVAHRRREIGTLLAIGFTPSSVFVSFLIESILLCLVGGALGCLVALPINGVSTGTTNWATFSELVFPFRITPMLLAYGMIFAVVMGVLGGALPAYRAARERVAVALGRV